MIKYFVPTLFTGYFNDCVNITYLEIKSSCFQLISYNVKL